MRTVDAARTAPDEPSIAAVGFFDGVHCGHRYLLSSLCAEGRKRGLHTVAVTFRSHPLSVLSPGHAPALLTTLKERLDLIAETGVDYCVLLDFTEELAKMSAEEFMRDVLSARFGVRVLLMGYDHRIGSDGISSPEGYREAGEKAGIEVIRTREFVPPSGLKVSSSEIRKAIAAGEMEKAALMLGRPYNICAPVGHGRHVGTSLGFPTANVDALSTGKVMPAQGVYAAIAETGGKRYRAVVNIGSRPTLLNGKDITTEAFLLDFNGDLYGSELNLLFISRLRGEKKFSSLTELKDAIAADAERARAVVDMEIQQN